MKLKPSDNSCEDSQSGTSQVSESSLGFFFEVVYLSLRGTLAVARRSRSKLEHETPRFTRNKLRNLRGGHAIASPFDKLRARNDGLSC